MAKQIDSIDIRGLRHKKEWDLPSDDRIVAAFGGFNFGDGSKDDEAKVRTLCKGLLQSCSGFSCGSTLREILVRLGLAKYKRLTLTITITAYGRRCILSAHKRLMQKPNAQANGRFQRPVERLVGLYSITHGSRKGPNMTSPQQTLDLPQAAASNKAHQRPDNKWQPIETAPLDGSHMLLYRPKQCFVGYSSVKGWIANAPGLPNIDPPPTHWQPLHLDEFDSI